jgi:hypothetical protein
MRWVYTIVILLAGLFVLMLSMGAGLQRGEAQALWAEGAVAEGTVTEILGRSGVMNYSYTFSYDGRVQTQSRRRIRGGAKETPIGSKLTVRYDPKDPSKSITQAELDEMEAWGNRFVFPLIGAALVAWALMRIFRRIVGHPPGRETVS